MIPQDQRYYVDLDKDSIGELIVAVDGLSDMPISYHDIGFITIIKLTARYDNWKIFCFERLKNGERIKDILIGDFDRDGHLEVAVRSLILGGSCSIGILRVMSGDDLSNAARLDSFKPSYRVAILERSLSEPALFVTSDYYLPAITGTAWEAVGCMGWQRELYIWKKGQFVKIGEAFVPLKWK